MKTEEADGGGRSRPSSGVWNLLSRLRQSRASSASSSSGSVSSVDSFAFVPAEEWPSRGPVVSSPPASPTPSYRRRVSDSHRRRSCERGLTLHTKYRLPIVQRGLTYDSFSLPVPRRAHVPGKRPAPPPPRPRPAKRLAPPPPQILATVHDTSDENKPLKLQKQEQDVSENKISNKVTEKKSEQVSSVTLRPNRSFLKQMFDNKKRNSAIEVTTPPIKLLPNISELDRQATEILQAYKLNSVTNNIRDRDRTAIMLKGNKSKELREVWLCTRCLKRYSPSTKLCSCSQMQETKPNNSNVSRFSCEIDVQTEGRIRRDNRTDDKEKLKEMLKEMKHSLPKDPRIHSKATNSSKTNDFNSYSSVGEAATLRIGANVQDYNDQSSQLHNSSQNTENSNVNKSQIKHIASISQIISATPSTTIEEKNSNNETKISRTTNSQQVITDTTTKAKGNDDKMGLGKIKPSVSPNQPISKHSNSINEPLKISTLLNPLYVPKHDYLENNQTKEGNKDITILSSVARPSCSSVVASTSSTNKILTQLPHPKEISLNKNMEKKTESSCKENNKCNKSEASSQTSAGNKILNSEKAKESIIIGNRDSAVKLSSRRELINKLERSISIGDEQAAAEAATKLAQLKLSCAVLSFSSQIARDIPSTSFSSTPEEQSLPKRAKNNSDKKDSFDHTKLAMKSDFNATNPANEQNRLPKEKNNPDKIFQIEIWIEDKSAARGPVRLSIRRGATMGALKQRVADVLGVALPLQRWVVRQRLCTNDTALLTDLAGETLDTPFYLCLVQSDKNQEPTAHETIKPETVKNKVTVSKAQSTESNDIYKELIQLEQNALVINTEPFECQVCMEQCGRLEGVVLRECVHMFCRECLSLAVQHCVEPIVACPAQECAAALQEREVRALVSSEEYERWLARGLATAESRSRHAFHCRTSDCKGWAFCEPGVQQFNCPVCKHVNCVSCKAIHEGSSCLDHKTRLAEAANQTNNDDEDGTKALLDTLIAKGEALKCPECSAIIVKKWGCDWVRCSACKTEICWVTRGPRWGPAGRGDTSSGCRCGVDGKKCHPSCSYCH